MKQRTEQMAMRLEPELKQWLKQTADAHSISMSTLLVEIIKAAMQNKKLRKYT